LEKIQIRDYNYKSITPSIIILKIIISNVTSIINYKSKIIGLKKENNLLKIKKTLGRLKEDFD